MAMSNVLHLISVLILSFLVCYASSVVQCQFSRAVNDSQLPRSKFASEALFVEDIIVRHDLTLHRPAQQPHAQCAETHQPTDMTLQWSTHIDTRVVAAPLIVSAHDARRIVVPGHFHMLTTLDAASGAHIARSPLIIPYPNTNFDSAILHAHIRDGNSDDDVLNLRYKFDYKSNEEKFVWASDNAEIFLIGSERPFYDDADFSPALLRVSRIPKLRVRADWTTGLSNAPCISDNKILEIADDDDTVLNQTEYKATNAAQPNRGLLYRRPDEYLADLPEIARASFLLFGDDDNSMIYWDDHDERDYPLEAGWIWVDAHILATPVLVDIDGDGLSEEIIIPMSYYFDADEFDANPHKFHHIPNGTNIGDYIGGGIVAMHLRTDRILYSVHLDLVTSASSLSAVIRATPTVADIDGDGLADVVVATSMGLVYAMRVIDGELLEGFPIVTGVVHAPVALADVNDDGAVELIIIDGYGNVICANGRGQTLWTSKVSGIALGHATIGDIDKDGILDVVIGTVSGYVWALRGDNGQSLDNFPIKTDGRITSHVTLADLHVDERHDIHSAPTTSLHLIFVSADGYVNIVDGANGCAHRIDIGESSYSPVLVDDLDNDGYADLIVATHNGNVHVFSSDAKFSFFGRRTKQTRSFVYGVERFAVTVSRATRLRHYVDTREVRIEYFIQDRNIKTTSAAVHYNVTISLDGRVIYTAQHDRSGPFVIYVPSPSHVIRGVITVCVSTSRGLFIECDEFSIELNSGFARTLKYATALPLFIMAFAIFIIKKRTNLPTDNVDTNKIS